MNQDQLADKLRELADVPPFTLVFSGKKNKKVDGLYKPATQEILIHNKNMSGDTDLLYTAIHEFAHHIVSCQTGNVTLSNRCHTAKFWAVFHDLLKKAEEKGIYSNPFKTDAEFIKFTKEIKENFLVKNGAIMKELAAILDRVRNRCIEKHLSFEDYVDRELGIEKTTANTLLRIEKYDVTLWEKHGVFAVGTDIMDAFDQVDVLNKAARIYLDACTTGQRPMGMSLQQMHEVQSVFSLPTKRIV